VAAEIALDSAPIMMILVFLQGISVKNQNSSVPFFLSPYSAGHGKERQRQHQRPLPLLLWPAGLDLGPAWWSR
jgi:hypothetical protein